MRSCQRWSVRAVSEARVLDMISEHTILSSPRKCTAEGQSDIFSLYDSEDNTVLLTTITTEHGSETSELLFQAMIERRTIRLEISLAEEDE